MQITTVLIPPIPVLAEAGAAPLGAEGDWAMLMAEFAEEPMPESPEVEALAQIDIALPDPQFPAIGADHMATTVESVDRKQEISSDQAPEKSSPLPIGSLSVPSLPEATALLSQQDQPRSDAPLQEAVLPVHALSEPPPSPPKRSKVENLWEMQGLIRSTRSPEVKAEDSPLPAPETPRTKDEPAPGPRMQLEKPVIVQPLVLAGEMTLAMPDQPDPQPFSLTQAGPVSLLHTPVVTPHNPQPSPTLAPAFLAVVQAQAATPTDGGVTISLTPVELGELQLSMRPEGDRIHVAITAERPETLELLRRHSEQLTQELRQAGFQAATFSFSQGGHQDRLPNSDAVTPDDSDNSSSPLLITQATPVLGLAPINGGLDLRM